MINDTHLVHIIWIGHYRYVLNMVLHDYNRNYLTLNESKEKLWRWSYQKLKAKTNFLDFQGK